RFGICPLFWSEQKTPEGRWLLFGSEIKALLASGMIDAKPDLRGLDQVFNFFAVPGQSTCFAGIQALQPGHYLRVQFDAEGLAAPIAKKTYWQIDFPDQGQEDWGGDSAKVVDGLDSALRQAVERRLRAD